MQAMAPVVLAYLPPSQGLHVAWPLLFWKVPMGHRLQLVCPYAVCRKPGGQEEQVTAPSAAEKLPGVQRVHEGCVATCCERPSGHGEHRVGPRTAVAPSWLYLPADSHAHGRTERRAHTGEHELRCSFDGDPRADSPTSHESHSRRAVLLENLPDSHSRHVDWPPTFWNLTQRKEHAMSEATSSDVKERHEEDARSRWTDGAVGCLAQRLGVARAAWQARDATGGVAD